MVFRNIFLFVGLMLFLSVVFTGETPHAQVPSKFKIYVSVSYDDEHIKSLIQSYIKREIRSLGDVLVVGRDDAQYFLSIVAIERTYRETGRKSGAIAFAYMFTKKTPAGDYYFPELWVAINDITDLEKSCKSIVVGIDTSTLEPIRELFQ